MKRLLVPVLVLLMFSCTDPEGARKTLERNNYKVISVGGYAFFDSNKDTYKTKFTAIAPNGEEVSGVVTKGNCKGSTIRLDN